MPRLSVIVPIHDVERYLPACLDSLLAQELRDFEAILVDDGSPDGSGEIAEAYAARDRRFRVVHQDNAGLGAARNTGVARAEGELLAFLDADDMVPPDGYTRMAAALDRTGSDFATGNVHRCDDARTWQAAFLARVFLLPRRRTHVSRMRWLLSDRMAQNKLWRRSFWDARRMRFPVGVFHEDIPVVIPAHVGARCVDVVRAPVYLYRERDDGVLSITQRRAEVTTLLHRLAAVEEVSLRLTGRLKRWYDESVVEDDLRYHLDVLDAAGDEYRALFLDRANAFLDRAHDGVADRLPVVQQVKWELVRERRLEELLAVIAAQKAGRGPADGRLATARRRARHAGALARPYVTPHRPPLRAPAPTAVPSAARPAG